MRAGGWRWAGEEQARLKVAEASGEGGGVIACVDLTSGAS